MSNSLKTALLLGLLSGVLLLIGEAFGGSQGLVFMFVVATLMNLGSYWFSDKIVLRMYNAKEVGPDHPLSQIVARLTRQANLPMPRVYVIPSGSPNAFARRPSRGLASLTPTPVAQRLWGAPTVSPMRFASSIAPRSRSRSTHIQPPRTCSSSSRSPRPG